LRKLLFFIVLLGCLVSSSFASAEDKKDEWVDNTYNFKQLKTVMVQYSFSDDLKLDESQKQKLVDKINAIFINPKHKSKLKFMSLNQVEDTIGKVAGADINELKVNDSAKHNDVMSNNLPNIVDAMIELKITAQGYTTEHVPLSSQWITQHHYTYITQWHPGYNGIGGYTTTQTIDTPTSFLMIIPAHDVQVGHAGAEFELLANNNPNASWRLTDVREAGGKEPIEMTERIFNRAIDRLVSLVKGQEEDPKPKPYEVCKSCI